MRKELKKLGSKERLKFATGSGKIVLDIYNV